MKIGFISRGPEDMLVVQKELRKVFVYQGKVTFVLDNRHMEGWCGKNESEPCYLYTPPYE